MDKEKYTNIVDTANNYYYAVRVLCEKIEGSEATDSLSEYMQLIFPIINIGALACELFLKALIYKDENYLETGHDLAELFKLVSEGDKVWCQEKFAEKISGNTDFDTEIDSIKVAYTSWRYLYERGSSEKDKKPIKPDSIICLMEILHDLCKKYKE